MKNFDLLIPTASGIEAVVKRQLEKLGYFDSKAINGRVKVADCDWQDIALLNLYLRSGERVFINLAHFRCMDFDTLYDNVKAIEWEQLLDKDCKFTVITKSVKSKLFAHNAIQSIAKKAIVDRLTSCYNLPLREQGSQFVIEVALFEDYADINVDTTGVGLHKRGYRTLAYTAPMKETTASALLDLSYWHADKAFADTFCGSGTLPIEACLKALNMAVGLNRDFLFKHWQCFPQTAYTRAVERAKDEVQVRKLDIYACDIDKKAIDIATFHAKKAGVLEHIRFEIADAKDFYSKEKYGVLISNPPYGERIGDQKQVVELAKNMGKVYKKLDSWNFYFLTPFAGFERCFGRSADKKRKLYNAGIECCYYSFNGPKPPKAVKTEE